MLSRLRLGDLLLPVAVVSVVGMMILPLPIVVLDLLLMCNLVFALSLIVASVYLIEPERFTALPTVLLLSTLFRLGLNISTTRQLLAYGEAPEIVATFGEFVVQGNLVVGAVIFAIITLVQFMVIAKGAERVAEVAARFTLDAMPGKQMSIDADVRAGVISLNEARERRKDLHRESKLYGALDGAMKFVKGDAIAGLIITVINISAGLLIGVYQLGMSFSEAAHRYTIFTVGDGLVSQIPALLVAVAAGICVTRVADKEGQFVSREMISQLSREPRAVTTTAAIVGGLALVPGLPIIPFLTLAAGMLLLSRKRQRADQAADRRRAETEFKPIVYSSLVMRLSRTATVQLQQEGRLPIYLRTLKSEMFNRWGVVIPDIQFDVDGDMQECSVSFYLKGVKCGHVVWSNPSEGSSVDGKHSNSISGFSERIIKLYSQFVEKRLAELVDDTHTRILFEVHQPVAEDLINSVVPSCLSVTALTTLLRQLINEQVSIRELRSILQGIAEFHLSYDEGAVVGGASAASVTARGVKGGRGEVVPHERRGAEMLSAVRITLARAISHGLVESQGFIEIQGIIERYGAKVNAAGSKTDRAYDLVSGSGSWPLSAWIVEPRVDALIAKVQLSSAPLDPQIGEALISRVSEIGKSIEGPLVLLASKYARPVVSQLLHDCGVSLRVVAYEELVPEVQLTVLGAVGIVSEESKLEQPTKLQSSHSEKVVHLEKKAA